MTSTGDMRVLVIGPIDSPHVTHLATAMAPSVGELVVAGCRSSPWSSFEPPDGVRTVVLSSRSLSLSRMGSPLLVARIRRLVDRYRPDVVHVHGIDAFAGAAARARNLVAASKRFALIVTAWGSDVLVDPGNGAVALRRADVVTADSPYLVEAAIELGAPRERTVIQGWGVDLNVFTPSVAGDRMEARGRLGLPQGESYMLSPRGLSSIYNPDVVAAAFDLVADVRPDVRLLVKHASRDRRAVPTTRHRDRVTVLGAVPYEQLADVYRAADVCVSIPSSDSAPRTVWEAMACGTPCVVSELPWLRGMLVPGTDVVAVPIDAAAVAQAILDILDHHDAAAGLAANGRARVEREHDAATALARWRQLYDEVANAARMAVR